MATDATRARALLDRAEAARIEYGTALAQIMDDAKAAGVSADSILPDIVLGTWARDMGRRRCRRVEVCSSAKCSKGRCDAKSWDSFAGNP